MAKVGLLPAATRDLESIHEYSLSEWGPAQAERYLTGLAKKLRKIASMPQLLGTVTHPGSPVRKAVYERHTMFYRETADGIEVGRIAGPGQEFSRELAAYEQYAKRQATQARAKSRDREPEKGI